jgi:hypothetical protein
MADTCPKCNAPFRRHHTGFHCGTEVDESSGSVIQSPLCRQTTLEREHQEMRRLLTEVISAKGKIPDNLQRQIKEMLG